jgi:hypothetical protein
MYEPLYNKNCNVVESFQFSECYYIIAIISVINQSNTKAKID